MIDQMIKHLTKPYQPSVIAGEVSVRNITIKACDFKGVIKRVIKIAYMPMLLVLIGLLLLTKAGATSIINATPSHTSPLCFATAKQAYAYLLDQQTNEKNTHININTAHASELMTLDGVGVKTAQAIVAYRKQMGKFHSIDDLIQVKGIGVKTLEKNRHRLVVAD